MPSDESGSISGDKKFTGEPANPPLPCSGSLAPNVQGVLRTRTAQSSQQRTDTKHGGLSREINMRFDSIRIESTRMRPPTDARRVRRTSRLSTALPTLHLGDAGDPGLDSPSTRRHTALRPDEISCRSMDTTRAALHQQLSKQRAAMQAFCIAITRVLIFKSGDVQKTNTIDGVRATNVCTEADTLSIYSALTY